VSPVLIDFPKGAVITVSLEGASVRVLSTVPGSATTVLAVHDLNQDPIEFLDENLLGSAVSTRGFLALPLYDENDGAHPYRTAVVNLNIRGLEPIVVPGRRAAFAPDGSLVTWEQAAPDFGDLFHVTSGLADGGTPRTVELAAPAGFSSLAVRLDGGTALADDGTGIVGSRTIEVPGGDPRSEPAILRWDGSVVARDPATGVWEDGGLRASGAAGERTSSGCDTSGPTGGGCVFEIVEADGTSRKVDLPANVFPQLQAWSPDGSALLFTSGNDLYRMPLADRSVTRLATLPDEPGEIVAMLDDALLLRAGGGGVQVVGLDGSVDPGVIPGIFALLVP
jgi:hypothetical protein